MATEKKGGDAIIEARPMTFRLGWSSCERAKISFENGVILEAFIDGDEDVGIISWSIMRHYQGTAVVIAGKQAPTVEAAKTDVIAAIDMWRVIMEPNLS